MPRIELMPPLGGIYNVRPEEFHHALVDEATPPDDSCFVWSTPDLPPPGSQEHERPQIAETLDALLQTYLEEEGFPRLNDGLEDVYGPYSLGIHADDREMSLTLGHPGPLTARLITRIQDLLRNRFPLWRVAPHYENLSLGIYPEGLRVGPELIPGRPTDDHPALQAWHDQALASYEARYGPLRRQLTRLSALLPASIENALTDGFAPLAAFDRHRLSDQPGRQTPILWILEPAETAQAFTLKITANGALLERLEDFPVDADGTILPSTSNDDDHPFQLRGYLPRSPAPRFDLALKRGHWPVLARATIESVDSDQDDHRHGAIQ